MLLSVKSATGTPFYEWREPTPCSDKVTRLLSILMAEESEPIMVKLVLYLQQKQNNLLEGFTIMFKDEEYTFVPKFIDRSVGLDWLVWFGLVGLVGMDWFYLVWFSLV